MGLFSILKFDSNLEIRRQLYQMMCVISIFFAIVIIITNLVERLPPLLNAGITLYGLTYVPLLFFARRSGRYFYKTGCIPIVFVLNWAWFFNNGSAGPIPTFFFGGAILLTIFLRGTVRVFALVGFTLNLLCLYYAEYLLPGLSHPYSNPITRMQDITVSVPTAILVCILTTMAALSAYESERERLAESKASLEATLSEIRVLRGLLPICSVCKKIRDDEGHWAHLEGYIESHSHASFSHGMCPECIEVYYGKHEAPPSPR